MMNIKQTCQYVLAALMALLSSCILDINLDYLKPTPKVVLNSIAIANQPLVATVSRSWFYTEENPNVTLKDARVDLYANNVYHEQLTWMDGDIGYNSKGFYTSTYRPAAGEHIQLIAHVNDFTEASFETVVPESCQLLRCTAELKRDSAGHEPYFFHITLKDKVTEQNFYMVRIEHGVPYWKEEDETWSYMWAQGDLDYSKEPLFDQNQSILDKVMGYGSLSGYFGCVFSDELINGEEYTLKITDNGMYTTRPYLSETNEEPGPEPPHLFRIYLYSLCEDYYRYLKTLQSNSIYSFSNELVDAGLAEPIKVYSNVSSGVGIGGACNFSLTTIEATTTTKHQN